MRLLLDTHTLVWAVDGASLLSPAALNALQDEDNQIFVSALCAWELAIKHASGRWPGVSALVQDYASALDASGFDELSFTSSHALLAARLPGSHKDPFDRGIAAQSILEELTLVSNDAALDDLGVQRLW